MNTTKKITLTALAAFSLNTQVNAMAEIDVADTLTSTVSAQVTGTGPLRKTGLGTLVLSSGSNDYTGGTEIRGAYFQ